MMKHALIVTILIISLALALWGCSCTPTQPEIPSETPSELSPDETPSETPSTPTSTVSSQTGILTEISGKVTVLTAGSTNWTEAEIGMQLEAGDRIKTEADSSALITFFEGSTTELQPNTEMAIEELSIAVETGATTVSLEQSLGKTKSRVAKLIDPGSRYEVTTPSGSAVVRGTEYEVEVFSDGSAIVRVYKGSVRAEREGKQEIVNAGYQISFIPGEELGPAIPISGEEGEGWGGGGGGGGGSTPEADFEASPVNGIAPLTVQFADLSEGIISVRLWDFGDDAISSDRNPTHTYLAPGSYTVSLTVYRSGRSDIETKPNYVTVYAPGDITTTVIVGEIESP